MNKPNSPDAYHNLLLSFIASMTLCDHMGDVGSDVTFVLRQLGMEIEWNEWWELGDELDKMGIKTLYGTSLRDDES